MTKQTQIEIKNCMTGSIFGKNRYIFKAFAVGFNDCNCYF